VTKKTESKNRGNEGRSASKGKGGEGPRREDVGPDLEEEERSRGGVDLMDANQKKEEGGSPEKGIQ